VAYVILDSFPHLVIARRVGHADEAAVSDLLARVDEHIHDTDKRSALVYDAGTNPEGQPNARARRIGGEWFKRRRRDLERVAVGFDFAFPSSISRGALTAVFWIAGPPVPYAIHDSSLAAIRSAIGRLGDEGRTDPSIVLAALNELARPTR
jgi:hypothetical protein